MELPVLAQDDVSAQEGLELLKAYTGISDKRVREKILTWVMDVHAASTRAPDHGSSSLPPADQTL